MRPLSDQFAGGLGMAEGLFVSSLILIEGGPCLRLMLVD